MISNNPGIISLYITKNIFKIFFAMFFGLFLLFFAVDFFETTKDLDKNMQDALKISTLIVLYRTPSIIETILHFIILLSGLFVFFKLSNNSEIVVMRSSGKSLFQIIKFPMIMIFFFGMFVITIYNPIASTLNMKSQQMDNIHFRNEKEDLLVLNNGIWFKQKNLADGGTIIIQASNVYKNILSIDELQEAEVPTQIKSNTKTPEESIEFSELKEGILEAMKKLPPRERELIEYKFFKEKKLREIAEEFNISQSRISRIIQTGLDRIKKDLAKQGII